MIVSPRVAQRRDRDHGGNAAAVLADVGQLVDVFDAARGLEHQRLEAGRDRRAELDAERLGAGDHFLRIGDVGRRDLVRDFGGRVAEHAFGADVEDLDHALGVGRDAREVGAVEDGALQRARRQQRLRVPGGGVRVGVDRVPCRCSAWCCVARLGGHERRRRAARQIDGEDASDAGEVARRDVPIVRFGCPPAEGEAQAQARSIGIALLERVKQPVDVAARPDRRIRPGSRSAPDRPWR